VSQQKLIHERFFDFIACASSTVATLVNNQFQFKKRNQLDMESNNE